MLFVVFADKFPLDYYSSLKDFRKRYMNFLSIVKIFLLIEGCVFMSEAI